MFRGSQFDKLLDKATSNLLMEVDWPSIMQICDLIRQNDVQPKYAVQAVKKRLMSDNPHSALYALTVLESMVKNCGSSIHEELTTKSNCDFLYELVKSTNHQLVQEKLLELIQGWNHALRNNPKHGNLKTLVSVMKEEGLKFPVLRDSDAMFSADSAPEWVDGDNCHRCRATFGIMNRKHHCRNCGQVFCGTCSNKSISLPKFGIEKEVRVCDTCFDSVTKPTPVKDKEELPAEYLKSSLAQQNQEPPRKSEDELREEEELQLALALSQSEAEAKEKEKMKITSSLHSTFTPKVEIKADRSPSPQDEQQNPELARYLNRSYWESLNITDSSDSVQRAASPTAPMQQNNEVKYKYKENGLVDNNLEEFIKTLKSQVEIFINRMKSNSSRGRSIANDTSVQTLFMNITAMHSQLLHYIQQHDDSRLHYERLQDKLTQVKDARAALDDLREEHREKLRREAEEAERLRQLQMAHKLDIMRKKKQEYLQYQRQLAIQRIQEQEREMQMRQEQQKQQYLMGTQYGYIGSPVHGQPFPPPPHQQHQPPTSMMNYQYPQFNPMMQPGQMAPPPQGMPPMGYQNPVNQQFPHPGQMPPMTNAPGMPNQPPPNMMMAPPQMVQTPTNAPPSSIAPPMQQYQPAGPPPPQQQQQEQPKKEEAQTGELISFD